MINNADGLPPYEYAIGGVTIPFIGVSAADEDRFTTDDDKTVTIKDAGIIGNPTYGQIADFTSAGPRRADSAIKPDITAPGVSVFSADGATTGQGKSLSGTSMASPAMAGVAALVKQAHPGWDPRDIKAAIVGTAPPGQGLALRHPVRRCRCGTAAPGGRYRRSASTTDPGSSSLTFGLQEAGNAPGTSTSFTETQKLDDPEQVVEDHPLRPEQHVQRQCPGRQGRHLADAP